LSIIPFDHQVTVWTPKDALSWTGQKHSATAYAMR